MKEGKGVCCCDASPGIYKDVTPEGGGPLGSKLVLMTMKPGESDTPHDHPAHYMYVLSGGKVSITGAPFPAGETKEVEMHAGAGMVMPPGVHQVSNVGETEIKVLFIEVTDQAGETPEDHITPQETDGCTYKTLAEDGQWMVVKMDLKAGEEDHPHSHRDHIVYCIDGDQLTIYPGKKKGEQKLVVDLKPGMVLPVPTGFHIVSNTGSKTANMVYFERKC
mmetsp:Transcript_1754/g.3174  ORF Transcript_1754/g.3174 Transcript_1754/m.3174 type:complete len:220 (-) Transcript_1754:260-919(-)|eukprot:CAMPEP_0197521228 /NCGR_PEP_ID=MMETSP1318-20131121/6508_1 /TAXON_ID=552666 /ORGANISM="Partenskyella glossopodia, Strain RCC365" /LENGTH=219 /DNA_ID=CAMNT_0043073117 /DNA_START=84 /DNA_END=743 /DNA_ORIENTATION=+